MKESVTKLIVTPTTRLLISHHGKIASVLRGPNFISFFVTVVIEAHNMTRKTRNVMAVTVLCLENWLSICSSTHVPASNFKCIKITNWIYSVGTKSYGQSILYMFYYILKHVCIRNGKKGLFLSFSSCYQWVVMWYLATRIVTCYHFGLTKFTQLYLISVPLFR